MFQNPLNGGWVYSEKAETVLWNAKGLMNRQWIGRLMISGLLLAAMPGADCRAEPGRRFVAQFSGTWEEAVSMPMRAKAVFRFNRDFTALGYSLGLRRGEGVLGVDLHCGRPGNSGPVIASLLGRIEGGLSGTVDIHATLTDANLLNGADCIAAAGLSIGRLADLAAAMERGAVYVEVTSQARPEAEIRGQVAPSRAQPSPAGSPLALARAAVAQALQAQNLAQAAAGQAAMARSGLQTAALEAMGQGSSGMFDSSLAAARRAAQTAALAITEATAAQAAAIVATRTAMAAVRQAAGQSPELQREAEAALRLAEQAQVLAAAALSEAQAARAAAQP
jgi:hypothetical protein